jgi:hypothetical protein
MDREGMKSGRREMGRENKDPPLVGRRRGGRGRQKPLASPKSIHPPTLGRLEEGETNS